MGTREGGRGGGWKALVVAIKLAISIALFVVLFRRIPFDSFREAARADRPEFLLAAVGLFFASNLLAAYQWRRLLAAAGIPLSFRRVLAYYHVGLFFNNFLPANIGGDIARVVDAGRHGPSRAVALSSVLMDRLIGTVALGGLALLTAWPAVGRFHLEWAYGALIAFFGLSVGLLWVALSPRWLARVERVLFAVGLGRFRRQLEELTGRLAAFRQDPAALAKLFGVALLTQLARVGVHALVARALGIELALHYFFLFVPLLAVIVSLPISFNGIGVREGAGMVLFGLVGVDRAHAFSLQFMAYLVAVAVSLLGGLLFLLRLPGRRRDAAPGVVAQGG
jgi:uncharacterized protein (TIRG00374 family)